VPALIGLGMTNFGRFIDRSLKDLAGAAIEEALSDAGLDADQIDMAIVANTVASITTGQVAVVGQVVLSAAGISGIPVFNVDNACAGSSSAVHLATLAVSTGTVDRVLVVGVEKLCCEDPSVTYRALNGAADIDWVRSTGVDPERESVFIKEVYQRRLRDYRDRIPLRAQTLAAIAVKNRRHASLNPLAQRRAPITEEQVLGARTVVDPVTTLMCAPIADGASAVVVASDRVARADDRAVWIRAIGSSMGSPPPRKLTTLERLAARVYADARIEPADIDLAEVHDATAFGELLAYEELGFCPRGQAAALVAAGDTSQGGRLPVNTSGGLESRGHPLAATGVAQLFELAMQLRHEAGERQVPDARLALAETAGGYVGDDSAAVAIVVLDRERARR
jgi:acetyl-CoA acyltransferase